MITIRFRTVHWGCNKAHLWPCGILKQGAKGGACQAKWCCDCHRPAQPVSCWVCDWRNEHILCQVYYIVLMSTNVKLDWEAHEIFNTKSAANPLSWGGQYSRVELWLVPVSKCRLGLEPRGQCHVGVLGISVLKWESPTALFPVRLEMLIPRIGGGKLGEGIRHFGCWKWWCYILLSFILLTHLV